MFLHWLWHSSLSAKLHGFCTLRLEINSNNMFENCLILFYFVRCYAYYTLFEHCKFNSLKLNALEMCSLVHKKLFIYLLLTCASSLSGSTKSSKTQQNYNSSQKKPALQSAASNPVVRPISNHLKSFTFNDLKEATKNFRDENFIGEGGFGRVYKGWINMNTFAPSKPGSGMVVAIKQLKPESFQGHKEWLVCTQNELMNLDGFWIIGPFSFWLISCSFFLADWSQLSRTASPWKSGETHWLLFRG